MSRLKGFFQKNLGLKLVSLILAIVLEIYFYSPDNSVISTIRARLEVVNLPPHYVITEPRGIDGPFTVEVNLRGPRTLIEQVRTANNRFRVSIPAEKTAQFSTPLDVRQLSLPTGVEVLNVIPERVTIKFEREVKKELLVVLDRRGMLPEGYRVEDVTLFPDSVVVKGPASKMEGLQAVETVAVDIEGLRDTVETELALKDLGDQVIPAVTMVRARIDISEIPEQRVFENVPVRVLAPPGFAASLDSSKATVVLSGPAPTLKDLSAELLKLTVDARALEGGVHELPPTADLPESVKILSSEPARLRVRLTAPRATSDEATRGEGTSEAVGGGQ